MRIYSIRYRFGGGCFTKRIDSDKSIREIAKELIEQGTSHSGFGIDGGDVWVMPSSIDWVEDITNEVKAGRL